jgi:hypothetical protein
MFFDFNRVQLIHRGVQQKWCRSASASIRNAQFPEGFPAKRIQFSILPIRACCENRERILAGYRICFGASLSSSAKHRSFYDQVHALLFPPAALLVLYSYVADG